jgi:hypothetical protein
MASALRSAAVNGDLISRIKASASISRSSNLALSLAVPEKVRFRYRLAEVDKDLELHGRRQGVRAVLIEPSKSKTSEMPYDARPQPFPA